MHQAEPICSPRLLEVLASKVHQHLGMDFGGPRRAELLRRLRQLAVEQEREPSAWLESLAFAEWDDAQVQALVPAFSVGETYFRRDAEALDWLARQHLAPLLQRRRAAGQRYLRVWSAACCTGEEAYSLLFILDELLGGDATNWTLELLASDINAGFLARAEQGRYGQNAFRRNEETFRSRYFQVEERFWRVRPEWRGRIRFLRHNLADQALPNPGRGMAAVDLILCRNVLMYFSAEHAAAALRRLLACLSDDGILVLSAVEAGLATQAGLSGFWAGSNYALGADAALPRVAPVTVPSVAAAPTPHALPVLTIAPPAPVPPAASGVPRIERSTLWRDAETALAQGRMDGARELLHSYLAQPGLAVAQRYDACLLMARSWADQQHSGAAREWLQRAVELDAAALPAYWLQALLARQEGDVPAALQALHKALYLDPDCSMLHFQQGLLLREVGRRQPGDKALRVCLRLLQTAAVDAPLPLGEGLSAGQLRQLCEQLLEGSP
jgi:chemotaxis protein methyltransferase CheR